LKLAIVEAFLTGITQQKLCRLEHVVQQNGWHTEHISI